MPYETNDLVAAGSLQWRHIFVLLITLEAVINLIKTSDSG